MAAVLTLPPHHLTARALEWLQSSEVIYGNGKFYTAPVGEAACDALHPERMLPEGVTPSTPVTTVPEDQWSQVTRWIHRTRLIREWSCNTEDIRAIWLSSILNDSTIDYIVEYQGPNDWVRGPVPIVPTCQECRVLMDRGLEGGPMKYGQYLRWYRRGQHTARGFRVPGDGLRWTFDERLVEQCPACKGTKVERWLQENIKTERMYGEAQCSGCRGSGHTTKGFANNRGDPVEDVWLRLQEAERLMENPSLILKLRAEYEHRREEAEVQEIAKTLEYNELPGDFGYRITRRRR